MPASKPRNERTVSTYCYQCVAGPDLLKVRIEDGVATEITPNFDAAEVHPAGGKACVKAFGLVQKAYTPNRMLLSDEADQSEQGPRARSRIRAHLLGRGARPRGRQAQGGARRGLARRGGLSAACRELRRRRHADRLYGHAAGLPRRLGPGRHELRLRAGRQVLSLRASLRRVVAPRLHRLAGYAAVRLSPVVRRQCRGLGRRVRRQAPCRRAQARHEARPDRAASLGHRRLLGRMGSDQAEDRLGLPLRDDPRGAARAQARAARPAVPQGAHLVALSRSRPNGYFLRDPETRKPLVFDLRTGRAVPFDTPDIDPALEGRYTVDGIEVGAGRRNRRAPQGDRRSRPSPSSSRMCRTTRRNGRRRSATCRPRRSVGSPTNISSMPASARRSRSKA